MRDFHFSQASLQDYLACPRRFKLRYISRQPWPSQVADPEEAFELHLRQGAALHRLIQQDCLGMPRDELTRIAQDEPLSTWWKRYLEFPLADLPARRLPEVELSATLDGNRVVGKFDLLAFEPGGRFVIVDWKTERYPPARDQLAARMQTVLYPLLLAEAGEDYNLGEKIEPANIEMVYWFSETPQNPQHFSYDRETHRSNRGRVESLLAEILDREQDDFPLTGDETRCKFCTYRSLCKRGSQAGKIDPMEGVVEEIDPYFDLDFDSLPEILY